MGLLITEKSIRGFESHCRLIISRGLVRSEEQFILRDSRVAGFKLQYVKGGQSIFFVEYWYRQKKQSLRLGVVNELHVPQFRKLAKWAKDLAEKDKIDPAPRLESYKSIQMRCGPKKVREKMDQSWKQKQRLLTAGRRMRVFERDNFRCKICGRSPKLDPTVVLHCDHVIPLAKLNRAKEASKLNNLQTLCEECNRAKGTKNISFQKLCEDFI